MDYDFLGHIELCYNGERISYLLSAGINLHKDNKRYIPSLAFIENYGMVNQKEITVWDNDEYLIGVLYHEILFPWVNAKTVNNADEFASLLKINGVSIEDFKPLMVLIEKAYYELGFFQEYIDKKTKNGNNP